MNERTNAFLRTSSHFLTCRKPRARITKSTAGDEKGARCLGKLFEGRGGKSGLVLAEVPSILRAVTLGVSLSDRHFLARWTKSCVHAPW